MRVADKLMNRGSPEMRNDWLSQKKIIRKTHKTIARKISKSIKRLSQGHNTIRRALKAGDNSTWMALWNQTDEIETLIIIAQEKLLKLRTRFETQCITKEKS